MSVKVPPVRADDVRGGLGESAGAAIRRAPRVAVAVKQLGLRPLGAARDRRGSIDQEPIVGQNDAIVLQRAARLTNPPRTSANTRSGSRSKG